MPKENRSDLSNLFFMILLLFNATKLRAQDERQLKKMLKPKAKLMKAPKSILSTPSYQIDLNQNGDLEEIKIEKRDNIDYVVLKKNNGDLLFETKLAASGVGAFVSKIQLVTVANQINCLLIYFHQGKSTGRVFEAFSRLTFITFHIKQFNHFVASSGPIYQHEKEKIKDQYWYRYFTVKLVDLDGNLVKDVLMENLGITKLYQLDVAKLSWSLAR